MVLNQRVFQLKIAIIELHFKIYSKIELLLFDKTTKDGYAIKSEDIFGASEDNPKILKCIEIV
jgi:molybdopterin biosynthesis enzyme